MFRSFVPAEPPKPKRSAASLAAGIDAEPHSDEDPGQSIGPPPKLARQSNKMSMIDNYLHTYHEVVKKLKTLAEEQNNQSAVHDIQKLLNHMAFLSPEAFYMNVFANTDTNAKYKSIYVICTTYFPVDSPGYEVSLRLYEEARIAARGLHFLLK